MITLTNPKTLIQLLYNQPKGVSCYPYIRSLNSLFSLYTWLKDTQRTEHLLYSATLKVSKLSRLNRSSIIKRKSNLTVLRYLRQSDAQKQPRTSKKFRSWAAINYLTPWQSRSTVWSESTLSQISSFKLLGFKSYSNAKKRFVSLNTNYVSFTPTSSSSDPLLPTKSFNKSSLGMLNIQRLTRYLSLRGAHLALSHDSELSSTLNLFRKAFRPRLHSRKRVQSPNPYLFLGLKPSFKPKASLVIDRFKLSRSRHKLQLSANSKLQVASTPNTLTIKPLLSTTRNEAYVRRKSLRFLKKYASQHKITSNKKELKLPRPYPYVFYRVSKVSRAEPSNHFYVSQEALHFSRKEKLIVRGNWYLTYLKQLRTNSVPVLAWNLFKKHIKPIKTKMTNSTTLPVTHPYQPSRVPGFLKYDNLSRLFLRNVLSRPKATKRWVRNAPLFRNTVSLHAKLFSRTLKQSTLPLRADNKLTKLLPRLSKCFFTEYRPNLMSAPTVVGSSYTYPLSLPTWSVLRASAYRALHDLVRPIASYGFVRSPFFFTNFWVRNRSGVFDTLLLDQRSYSKHSYTIFPEANAMKTIVFRNLVNQRTLQESRVAIFESTPFKPQSLNTLFSTRSFGSPQRAALYPHANATSLVGAKSVIYKLLAARQNTPTRYLKPRRIRFKPGYSRLWRIGRKSIKEILDIKAHYQYRLNPQLQAYYHQRRNKRRLLPELTLEFALMKSHYAPDRDAVRNLLDVNGVFLNGTPVSNNTINLFSNDFIQLVVNLKFYIALRWIKTWFLLRKNRVSKVFYRKYRPAPFNKNIRIVRELPRWFFDLEFTGGDISRCFEMDYFTLSIFVLPYPLNTAKLVPTRSYHFDARILNMYNWKYIT